MTTSLAADKGQTWIEAFSDAAKIAAVRSEWDSAARQAGVTIPYCAGGYGLAVVDCYHAEDAPILFRTPGTDPPVYFLTIERPVVRFGRRIRERGFPFNPNTILNDPILAPGRAGEDQAAALLQAAFEHGCLTVILDNLPAEHGAAIAFQAAAARLKCPFDDPRPARTFYHARLPGDWPAYLATRSRNHRWQIKKALKTAAADGNVHVDRLSGRDAIRSALPDWFAIESKSWQASDPASAMQEQDRRFHARLLDTLRDDEVGDLWLVRYGDRPVAALRMLAGPGVVSVHTMHFDAAEKRQAPGLLAFIKMMQAACDEGLEEVDMHGRTEFFSRWATGTREHVSLRVYRPGLQGQALAFARRVAVRVRAKRTDAD